MCHFGLDYMSYLKKRGHATHVAVATATSSWAAGLTAAVAAAAAAAAARPSERAAEIIQSSELHHNVKEAR